MPPFLIVAVRGLAGLLVATVLLLAVSAEEPVRDTDKGRIAELIRKLGDDDFKAREKASKDLESYGEAAREQLQKAARDGADVEVQRRAQKLLDLLDQERRLASGMHVVGLYEAGSRQHFRLIAPWGQDTDWIRLCAAIADQGRKDDASPGKRLWELLPRGVQVIVADKDLVAQFNATVQGMRRGERPSFETLRAMNQLTSALQGALRQTDFYDEKSFAAVTLDDEGKQLVKQRAKLSLLESWVLNRRLLEASFPEAVKKSEFSLDRATVPVRVTRTKAPITLVLCSYESVRWVIQADKGARIEKVIVGGYHLQAVSGTDAPITYRVYEHPERPMAEPRYFYAYKQDQESYPKLVEALRQLTGKEIATFQGRYSYEKGAPFVVGTE